MAREICEVLENYGDNSRYYAKKELEAFEKEVFRPLVGRRALPYLRVPSIEITRKYKVGFEREKYLGHD